MINLTHAVKRWMAPGVMALGMAMSFGCKRDHNPLLATPAAGANQLIATLISIDISQAPELRMTFDAETDLGPVTDLLLGNVAILVDSKPEIPLRLDQNPIIPGRYTLFYRSRSTNSSASWHDILLSYGDLPVTYINP
jgi:hypothetical protein